VTFERIRVAERTAVDPTFLFDIGKHANENTIFADTTSDRFFAGLPAQKRYDLIFIDGIHTFEQTYRDLCNSLLPARVVHQASVNAAPPCGGKGRRGAVIDPAIRSMSQPCR
jgi:hypothetical protein